jgi:hypothetical protein
VSDAVRPALAIPAPAVSASLERLAPRVCPRALAPEVHAVRVDCDLVFLHVARDLYVCLAGAADCLASDDAGRRVIALSDSDLAAALVGEGLIVGAAAVADFSPPPASSGLVRPARDLVSGPPDALRWRDLDPIARTSWEALFGYWRRPLAALVATAKRDVRPGRSLTMDDALAGRVRRFQTWIPFAPVPGKCLARSFLLLRHLRRHGHDARWVFGVKTWPFAAHCWLQVDDTVLDDAWERVAAFEPILVL